MTIAQPLNATIRAGSGSIVNINNTTYQPIFETLDPNSTVNFNTYSAVPIAVYGNLNLNGSGLKTIAAGTMEVQGNLTLANGMGMKGASSNGTTVKVTGDLITAATVATASADNRVSLQFTNAAAHNITGINDQSFYKIMADPTATVTFNNTSGTPKILSLGSLNGGGLDLANGSTLVMGNNTLALTNKSAVNPTNATGEISIINGTIQLTTTAPTSANFYFDNIYNKVQNFTLQSTAGGITYIKKAVEIYDGLKINNGVLNAGGFVRLKSSATASASIPQIVSGSITGNVAVERYMSPKRVYRYLSSPVALATIAQWQNYFPITGNFPESTTGSGLTTNASMFYYTEPSYIAYPTTNSSAVIQVGRGYSTFIREAVNPINMVSTGVPNQGTIPFTLTPGASSSTGWNLLGNPYASDIVWATTGWTSSGVALPSRSDVTPASGMDALAAGSAYARPGSGFMPGWPEVQKAFQDAFTAEIQNGTFSADPVVAATSAAITTALAK